MARCGAREEGIIPSLNNRLQGPTHPVGLFPSSLVSTSSVKKRTRVWMQYRPKKKKKECGCSELQINTIKIKYPYKTFHGSITYITRIYKNDEEQIHSLFLRERRHILIQIEISEYNGKQ